MGLGGLFLFIYSSLTTIFELNNLHLDTQPI